MTPEKANLYSIWFVRALSSERGGGGELGLFVFRGWELARCIGQMEEQYLGDNSKLCGGTGDDSGPPGGGKGKGKNSPEIYPFVHGMADKPKAVNIALDLRGNPNNHGEEVPRAFITVLGAPDKKPYSSGSGRLDLANDIVASPIASRVWVNRVWKWQFRRVTVCDPQ